MDQQLETSAKTQWIHLLFKGSYDTNKFAQQCDIQRDEYVDEFAKVDQTAITIPILKFQFKNIDQLANLIRDLPEDSTNGLIIVSPRVVEALERSFGLFDEETRFDLCRKFDSDLIFVVGTKSAEECESRLDLRYNRQSAECGDGADLIKFIKTYLDNNNTKRRPINLIYPRGSKSDNNIEESLANEKDLIVSSDIFYETTGVDDIYNVMYERLLYTLPSKIISNKIVINLIFFSPSGVECFDKLSQPQLVEIFHKIVPDCKIEFRYSSIGKTTENALVSRGLDVFCVSAKPCAESLIKCCMDLITG